MTAMPSGLILCDRCGSSVSNGSVNVAVTILAMDVSGQPVNLHLGVPEGCASAVLFGGSGGPLFTPLQWRQTSPDSPGPVFLYIPPSGSNIHPDSVIVSSSDSTTEG